MVERPSPLTFTDGCSMNYDCTSNLWTCWLIFSVRRVVMAAILPLDRPVSSSSSWQIWGIVAHKQSL